MMTHPQMRIALGKATGFKAPNGWETTPSAYPDVMVCLNAVAKAEALLLTTDELCAKYATELGDLQARSHRLHFLITATAAQRSEGLLKAIGKYV